MNTRRVGAIVSGPVIGLGSMTALGYQGVFAACAALAVLALAAIALTRTLKPAVPDPDAAQSVAV